MALVGPVGEYVDVKEDIASSIECVELYFAAKCCYLLWLEPVPMEFFAISHPGQFFAISHPGQSFSLSLCGPISISRANAHMVHMGLKSSTSHYTLFS